MKLITGNSYDLHDVAERISAASRLALLVWLAGLVVASAAMGALAAACLNALLGLHPLPAAIAEGLIFSIPSLAAGAVAAALAGQAARSANVATQVLAFGDPCPALHKIVRAKLAARRARAYGLMSLLLAVAGVLPLLLSTVSQTSTDALDHTLAVVLFVLSASISAAAIVAWLPLSRSLRAIAIVISPDSHLWWDGHRWHPIT